MLAVNVLNYQMGTTYEEGFSYTVPKSENSTIYATNGMMIGLGRIPQN